MKKTVLILMLGVLFIASNLFAAGGDFIVEGNVGIGTGTPGANLQIKGAAAQSANLMSIVDSSDTSILALLPSGRLNLITTNNTGFFGTANYTGSIDIGGLAFSLQQNIVSDTDVVPVYTGISSTISFAGTTAVNTINTLNGSKNNIRLESTSAISKTINNINGNTFSIRVSGASSTYNIGKINGFTLSPNYISGTINVGTFNGFNVSDFVNLGITNLNAFNIADQTGGENNTNILIGTGTTGNWSIYNNSNYNNYFAGALGIGTTTAPTEKLEVNGGVKLNTTSAKPTCSATTRGTFWFTQGATGVKDSVQVCAKDAANAYAWRTIY
jgi:hypothetical protein